MRYLLFLVPAILLAQDDPAVRKCTVAGVVVQETSGAPLRQVEIGLVPVREPKPGQPTPAAIGVYSDSNGQFRIPELEPGVYRVRLRKEGFSPTLPSGSIILPKLEPGQELADLKFTMAPQSVLAGRVLDDNGDPVANANVMLFRASTIRGRRTLTLGGGFAKADDRGLFHMAGIDPGRYLLAADEIDARDIVFPAGGGALTAYVTTYYPGVSDDSQAQVIEVQRGTVETGIEIRMRREPVFSVRGLALDANGQPLQRFMVNARRAGAGQLIFMGSPPALFTNGEFSLPGLRSGAWILTAVPNGTNTLASAEIQVGSGPVEGVVLRPLPKQVIGGTAVLEGAGNIAPDWSRIGISMVAADMQSGARAPATDPSGQFAMTFHGTGKAYVNVVGTPAPGTYLARVLLGAEDVTGKELDVSAGGMPPLKLVFRPGAATLQGRAENADLNLLAGRPAISLWPVDPAQRDARAAISGIFLPDGTFTITDIRPGEYLAYVGLALEPGPYGPDEPPEDLETLSTRVKLEPGATQNIVVRLPKQRSAQ
ncbi:MAG: carboxypeptidase regulatory-like domain-containing protein [Bryobacterales bacterium]|nr:carboxypeptidase regulatory-like domain-containing protein [Bryobacterales bacterium]